ncbi:DUF3857 domain-containing protein [Sphingomonas pokkalii]|uniref:DUF3857 domain-containing protein n=1 Tax=Sphingomonas pokkalii TaxID=2175090 RepID=A0A2U0SE92_9SPHN|nr:DUF3857 domain-containing protein [Sphingomonas pokkalii]PVX29669.1 hypothetical protein DD559_10340 [Sphingomonas pokkalii]
MSRRSALVVVGLSMAGVAHAGDKVQYQAAPAWVASAPGIDVTQLNDSAPVMQIFDQQHRLEAGQVWSYVETGMRMVSPQMLTQAGTLPLQWDPSKGDLIIHKLQILRGNERIDLLAKGTRFTVLQREQKLEQFALDGTLTATVALEGLRVGDVVDVAFSITRKDPALAGQMVTIAQLVPAPAKLGFGRVRLLWKDGVPLQWRSYAAGTVAPAGAPQPQPTILPGGYRELSFPLPSPKPAEMPDDAPPRFKPLPLLEASTYADWAAVSKGMAPYYATAGAIAPGSPLAGEVARIVAASKDPRVRAAMALQLVQDQVRYLFRGMDTGNYVPQKPAETWSLRYGDCKAKTLLLLALLHEMGIAAEPAVVSVQMSDLVQARLPSPAAFDHVIVRATIDGKTLWLDGTQGGSRLADLDDVPPFVTALPLRPEGATLEPLPLQPPGRPAQDIAVTLDSTPGIDFPARFTFRATYTGGMAEGLRGLRAQIDDEKLKQLIGPQINGVLGANSSFDRKLEDDPKAGTVTLSASGIAYPDWGLDRGRQRLPLDWTSNNLDFSPNRARPAWKAIPVTRGGFADMRVVKRIRLPDGGKGYTLEGQQTLPATLANLRVARSVALAEGVLTLDDRRTAGVDEVPADRIAAVRAEVARVKANPLKAVAPANQPPRWQTVQAARADNRLAPILEGYAKAIAADPDDADSYTNRAWFLERIYDHAGALADLSKAIELAPSAELLARRAGAFDRLGQEDKAIADLDAALALDQNSDDAIGLLATIKARRGALDEARALLDERIALGGDEKLGWQITLANLLGDYGKPDDALAVLEEAIAAAPGNATLLNQRCWVRGTHNLALEAALKDCTKGIELTQDNAAILDSRAMVYFRMNRLPDALTDLDAALLASPDQASSLYLRGVIAKRSKAPDADRYLAAAKMIDPLIADRFTRYGIKP